MFYDYDRTVTIYHLDKYDKYCIGSEEFRQIRGTGLPFSSTDIAPPSTPCKKGYIYVFKNNKWEEVADTFKKVFLNEINYTYGKPIPPVFKKVNIDNPIKYMPEYKGVPKFSNPANQALVIAAKFSIIQDDFLDIVQIHGDLIESINNLEMRKYYDSPHMKLRIKTEGLILSMRTLLDELTQLTYILAYNDKFNSDLKIEIDSVGLLFYDRKSNKHPLCKDVILGDEITYEKDESSFIRTLNNLFNSIKHSHIHYESLNTHAEIPNVVSFSVMKNDFTNQTIDYHNHSLFHIIFGFIDNFFRIIENQKKLINHLNDKRW